MLTLCKVSPLRLQCLLIAASCPTPKEAKVQLFALTTGNTSSEVVKFRGFSGYVFGVFILGSCPVKAVEASGPRPRHHTHLSVMKIN